MEKINFNHTPIMLDECIKGLNIKDEILEPWKDKLTYYKR